MNTLFLLMAEHETAIVPLEIIASKYLGLDKRQASVKANTASLPFPAFRGESQKTPWLVSLVDVAKWLDKQRETALKDYQNMNS